jgi:hypothetical protein
MPTKAATARMAVRSNHRLMWYVASFILFPLRATARSRKENAARDTVVMGQLMRQIPFFSYVFLEAWLPLCQLCFPGPLFILGHVVHSERLLAEPVSISLYRPALLAYFSIEAFVAPRVLRVLSVLRVFNGACSVRAFTRFNERESGIVRTGNQKRT